MTAQKSKIALGTTISRLENTADPGLSITEVTTISGPTSSADNIDVTSQLSSGGFREFKRGLADPGTISFTIFYNETEPSHDELTLDFGDITTGPTEYQIRFPGGGGLDFSAKVNGLEFSIPLDGAITADVTLQVSGPVTYI